MSDIVKVLLFMNHNDETECPDPINIPINGTLDLHTFHPGDLKELIPEYLETCREKGIFQVRIIHGKGTGTLRRTVIALLAKLDIVASYRTAGEDGGGWGATIVTLKNTDPVNSR